ncbi:MAG TPA: serpin family protein [Pirellulaceae bacterium]|nr:serpin family protein [Pirellulaceae bacterium]HMO93651.1 serpin family protein [Pirellulaceae bacterium]HMP70655.1 serpin family protein [Pirellulaceae bacterium]
MNRAKQLNCCLPHSVCDHEQLKGDAKMRTDVRPTCGLVMLNPPWVPIKVFSLIIAVAMLALAGCIGVSSRQFVYPPLPTEVSDDAKQVSVASNQFALNLYQLLGEREGNLFFSPASIATALTMTYSGAEGETHAQMGKVLNIDGDENKWLAAAGELSKMLNAQGDGYELRMANRLWGQTDYAFRQEFLDHLDNLFFAPLGPVDFITETEAARRKINGWVEEATNSKIKDLLPMGILTDKTRLVLTNAIYFKANWKDQFRKAATAEAPFHVSSTQSKAVPMMYQSNDFLVFEDELLQLLTIPYENENLSMSIFLPRKIDGLSQLEKDLSLEKIQTLLAGQRQREVRLYLPRFRMTDEFALKKTLSQLGMPKAFSDAAEFGRISSQEQLSITEVVHKSFVEVDEQGTEAAAATGVVIGVTSAPVEQPLEFRADRPFLLMIRHEPSGLILFLGRLADPH